MTVILGPGGGITPPPPPTPAAGSPGVGGGNAYIQPPPTIVSRPSYGGFTLSSSRGSVALQGNIEALVGWTGLGPPRRTAVTANPLGLDGLRLNRRRPVTRSAREMGGPIHVQGGTALERAREMRQLLAVLSPLDDGVVTFTARIETGELVSGECVARFSGGDEWMATAAWDVSAVLELDLLFPDPRFYGETRRASQSTNTSGPFFPIAPVTLTNSTTFGTLLNLNVGGERPTHATFKWSGPGTKLTVTGSGGEVWEINLLAAGLPAAPLLSGQQVTVITDPRAVGDGASRIVGPGGVDYWKYLTRRTLFPLSPGKDSITIDVLGSGAGSEVMLEWRPAIEAIL